MTLTEIAISGVVIFIASWVVVKSYKWWKRRTGNPTPKPPGKTGNPTPKPPRK